MDPSQKDKVQPGCTVWAMVGVNVQFYFLYLINYEFKEDGGKLLLGVSKPTEPVF